MTDLFLYFTTTNELVERLSDEAFALGQVWRQLPRKLLNFQSLEHLFNGRSRVRQLPPNCKDWANMMHINPIRFHALIKQRNQSLAVVAVIPLRICSPAITVVHYLRLLYEKPSLQCQIEETCSPVCSLLGAAPFFTASLPTRYFECDKKGDDASDSLNPCSRYGEDLVPVPSRHTGQHFSVVPHVNSQLLKSEKTVENGGQRQPAHDRHPRHSSAIIAVTSRESGRG